MIIMEEEVAAMMMMRVLTTLQPKKEKKGTLAIQMLPIVRNLPWPLKIVGKIRQMKSSRRIVSINKS